MSDSFPEFEILREAVEKVISEGFLFPLNPNDSSVYPAGFIPDDSLYALIDLTESQFNDISESLQFWTQLSNWANSQLARAESMIEEAEELLADYESDLLEKMQEADQKIKEKWKFEATLRLDLGVRQRRRNLLLSKAYYRIVKSLTKGYEANYAAVSRELTRRINELDRESRSSRVGSSQFDRH